LNQDPIESPLIQTGRTRVGMDVDQGPAPSFTGPYRNGNGR
jgi:hypothetical protein